MVLTRSITTTNNAQRDEPRAIALKREVQTLDAAMERLTKQNHNLEEQLHQKNTGLNTQEEDQEGTSTKRRNQEGLEGSNALSKPEGQDTNQPFVTDTVPPHIVAEM